MTERTEPWLVVGLGNPGRRYAGHRHNIGHMVIDLLADRVGAALRSHRAGADVLQCRLEGLPVVLAKPHTYMNLSGGPVAGLSRFYHVPVAQVVVVHDDLDLPFGQLRVKAGGGEGGHNGLRSVSGSLASRDYVRVRCGVGRPADRIAPAAWVLSDFGAAERGELTDLLERAADAVASVLTDGLAATQNRFN